MASDNDDIPSLTLQVLQNIQGELVGLRADVRDVRTELETLKTEVRHELRGLNGRFDNFLTFVGHDVQDLKARVSALEEAQRRS